MSPDPHAVETAERPVDERRAHRRHDVDAPAELTLQGRTVEGRLENVGAGGVCFVTEDRHLVVASGNFVRVTFDCEKDGAATRLVRTVRVLRVDTGTRGDVFVQVLGLQFEELLKLDGIRFP